MSQAPDIRSIALGGVAISFQRFPLPPHGVVDQHPASHGSLPLGRVPGGWLLPVARDEAFWIGLGPATPTATAGIAVAVWLRGRRSERDALTGRAWSGTAVLVPPHRRLPGLGLGNGPVAAFHRSADAPTPACRRLRFVAGGVEAVVWPVGIASFCRATGLAPPAPLDRAAAYGGWRLP